MKAITTKYFGPGNVRGSKIIASDGDHNRIQLSWDDSKDSDENHKAAAQALCRKLNWKGRLSMGWLKDRAVHTFIESWTTYEV